MVDLAGSSVMVTGGASGLGWATAVAAARRGATVTIADLKRPEGLEIREALGDSAQFVTADVTEPDQVLTAAEAANRSAPLRAVVHTAGQGGPVRLLDKEGRPGDSARFERVVRTNLVGTFVVASAAASVITRNEPIDGERGALVFTASVAAWEGQIGQTGYAASKAGVVGLTLVAARDLSGVGIRVNTIAPGIMSTPMLSGLREDIRDGLARSVPFPHRFGNADEYADLAMSLLTNGYLNGETVRLDGAIRMPPR